MPQEILVQIVKEKLMFEFAVVLCVYFLTISIIFKLNLQILGLDLKYKKMIPNILILMTYTTVGKQFLSGVAYSLVYIIITAILIILLVRNKIAWIKVVWSSLLGFAISGIGLFTIQIPLSLQPTIGKFITTTPFGVACGAICEGICPMIAYFLLKTVDISIIPPVKRRVDLLDLGNLYIFTVPLGFLYSESMQMLKNIGVSPISDLIKSYIYQLFIAVSLPIVYYFVYTNTKKRHLDIVQKLESEKDNLTEQLHNVIAFDRELDPQIKQIIVDSFIKMADNNAEKKKKSEKPSFKVNYSVMALLGLKERDAKICGFLVLNMTNKEIAEELNLSAGYVSNTISEMIQKFGLSDRHELARFALNKQLVELI